MLRAMSFAPRLDAPRLLQYAALLAALGGVATWSVSYTHLTLPTKA